MERTIVVTGGMGFIGSNYLNYAVRKYPQYRFVNVDVLTYAANPKNIAPIADAPNYVFEKVDIRDREALAALFEKYKPTDIIHFAAESHVDVSLKNPDIFVETNVLGTHHLIQLAIKHQLPGRFHHISTDEVYGSLPIDAPSSKESDELSPSSPYSASKAAAEMFVHTAHHTFNLDTVITRASNNYGPNQHEEKFIPLFLRNLLRGEKVPLYGTGTNIRNWLHVRDHVLGIDLVFHHGKSGETYNLGGPDELANVDIVTKLLALTGRDTSHVEYVTDRLGHDLRYSLDSSKAKREVGWEPTTNLDEGLAETLEHYRERFN